MKFASVTTLVFEILQFNLSVTLAVSNFFYPEFNRKKLVMFLILQLSGQRKERMNQKGRAKFVSAFSKFCFAFSGQHKARLA